MCKFLFTSYRQQHLSDSCNRPVCDEPHHHHAYYKLSAGPTPALPVSAAPHPFGHCYQCATVSAEGQGLTKHHYNILLPIGLSRHLLVWFLTVPFFPSLQEELFSHGCSHHVSCSRGQGNIQCLKGELTKSEHKSVFRSQGTQVGRNQSLIPPPQAIQACLVWQEQGQQQKLWTCLCPVFLILPICPQFLCVSLSYWYIAGYEYHCRKFCVLVGVGFFCFLSGWFCSCFPRAPMQNRKEEIPQSPPLFFIDFQQCIEWGAASSHMCAFWQSFHWMNLKYMRSRYLYDFFFQDIRGIAPSPLQNDEQHIYYFFFRLHHLSLLGYQDTQSCCNISSQCTKTQFACCCGKMLRTRWNELCFCLNVGKEGLRSITTKYK